MRKAIITGPGAPLKVVDAALPEVPPEGAVIRTLYAGVCHSDLHFIEDEMHLGNGKVFRNRDVLGDKFIGLTPGHEICGVIEKIGIEADTVNHSLSVGDRVCVYPWIGCQECGNCKIGRNNICLDGKSGTLDIGQGEYGGGYGSHVAVPKTRFLVKVPESVPMSMACMLPCSAATSLASLKKGSSAIYKAIEARGTASILIIGAGGLGLWCTTLAKKALFPEHVKIVVADISEDKIKVAKDAGADDVIIWGKGMSEEEMVMKATNRGKDCFDLVANFVGSPLTSQVGLKSLMLEGIQVVLGLFGGQMTASLPFMISRSLSLVASRTSSLDELKEVVNIVSDKGLDYSNLRFFTLDEINKALDELEAGKIEGRALIKYE